MAPPGYKGGERCSSLPQLSLSNSSLLQKTEQFWWAAGCPFSYHSESSTSWALFIYKIESITQLWLWLHSSVRLLKLNRTLWENVVVCKLYVKLFLRNRKYIAPTFQVPCEDSVIEVLPNWHCVRRRQGVPK